MNEITEALDELPEAPEDEALDPTLAPAKDDAPRALGTFRRNRIQYESFEQQAERYRRTTGDNADTEDGWRRYARWLEDHPRLRLGRG